MIHIINKLVLQHYIHIHIIPIINVHIKSRTVTSRLGWYLIIKIQHQMHITSLFSFLVRGVNDLETEPNAVKGKKQSDKTIFVVVEDGRVQEVYACASLAGVEVEILDKDDAKVSEDAAWRSTLQRIAEVAEQYTQIY